MTHYTLTLVDVRRVQQYLFNANELKQNLGASSLIEQATSKWIIQVLTAENFKYNVLWKTNKHQIEFDPKKKIENGDLDAEVIFMGGGNVAILFSLEKQAKVFSKQYSKRVLENAPGLEIAIGHVDVTWDEPGTLKDAWKRMQEIEMPQQKEGRLTSQPLISLGVTAECAFTGLPAIYEEIENNRGTLMSAEAVAKKEHVNAAQERLNALLNVEGFNYPLNFDDLGGEHGRARYIAIIHADGNSMGNRIVAFTESTDNREMADKMRLFSNALNRIGSSAMEKVRDWMCISPKIDAKGYFIEDQWRPDDIVRMKENFLPIRPIVFGGDDVTFVSDGRLGLALAAKFLEAFSQENLPDGYPGYACAGIAIVHSHYPFARAYALAEELCRDAKNHARDEYKTTNISLLNWHYASSGLTLNWEEITKREYMDGKLIARPLVVTSPQGSSLYTWRTWDSFLSQVQYFRQEWRWGRNKLKDLRNILRDGKNAVQYFTRLHGELPIITGLETYDANSTGWYADRCVYYDALEAEDLFIYPQEYDHA
jgi:hypothetical protein